MTSQEVSERLGPGAGMRAVLLRLRGSGTLSPASAQRVEALETRTQVVAPHTLLQAEDTPARRPRFLLSGWACRFQLMPDGRRQIFDWVLPGEGLSVGLRSHPLSQTGVGALTPVRLVDAAPLLDPAVLAERPDLRRALEAQTDAAERRMLDQIMRLGRMTAPERLAHLLLDLHDRLDVVRCVHGGRFELPLTQEAMADAAGLSVVHVNRTLQELRRQGLADVGRGFARLPDLKALRHVAQQEAASGR